MANVPAYGTEAVAQFVFALLLEVCHHVGHHDRAVKAGRWSNSPDFCFWDFPLIELAGKTMGFIGFGRIGRAAARIARCFGMKTIAFARHPDESGAALAEYVTLEELYERADIMISCALFPNTTGINAWKAWRNERRPSSSTPQEGRWSMRQI